MPKGDLALHVAWKKLKASRTRAELRRISNHRGKMETVSRSRGASFVAFLFVRMKISDTEKLILTFRFDDAIFDGR